MKKYWIKDLDENQVIHAPTEEIAKRLCDKFDMLGLEWFSGEPYSRCLYWDKYREETCYLPSKGQYCDLSYYAEQGYEIIIIDELMDFQAKDKTFPRWMMVGDDERSIGSKRLVLYKLPHNALYPYIAVSGDCIEEYEKGEEFSINIYKYAKEIDEPEEMTLEQVCKELGREIKIIK